LISRLSIFSKIFLAIAGLATLPLLLVTALLVSSYQEMIATLESDLLPLSSARVAAAMSQSISHVSLDVFILVGVTILVSLVLVVFAALFLSREFSRPITALAEATRQAATGDLDVRLETTRQDEFGDLAAGFNRMASQLKEARAVLEEANVALENRVAQRTAELEITNFQLQATAAKTSETMRLKSEFLANISHELLTPLHAVLGYSELLGEGIYGALNQKQRESLGKIRSSSEMLQRLINDIIDLARIEAGRMTLAVESFAGGELLQSVADSLAPLFEKKGLTLVREFALDLPPMRTDRAKVQHVLFNLLSNALKFTPTGSVTLHARADLDAARLIIEVRDTGPGISGDKVDAVFEGFRQLDGSTKRRAGGVGIGLTLTRQLVDVLGGDIFLQSSPGEGATFRVKLPLVLEGKADDLDAEIGQARQTNDQRPKIILAIDDDEDLLDLLRATLEPAGYTVEFATDAATAIAKAAEFSPFAVTLDIQLPERDGWSVLSELRARPETADIPVIVLSVVDDRAQGDRMGVHGYITKPFDREHLIAELQAINGVDNHLH
jgi:signal transduction histidine kinase/ActR/RegA family two-component response regulator